MVKPINNKEHIEWIKDEARKIEREEIEKAQANCRNETRLIQDMNDLISPRDDDNLVFPNKEEWSKAKKAGWKSTKKLCRQVLCDNAPSIIKVALKKGIRNGRTRLLNSMYDFLMEDNYIDPDSVKNIKDKFKDGNSEQAHNELVNVILDGDITPDNAEKVSKILKTGEDIKQGGEVTKLIDELEKKIKK